ncbi:threonine--tRNA ligase [Candidatus Profftella armatura (Diaphorina cf. continua)]|uniref:Threonine--tRNA ligase n=1 Tax=Candidatus Profftella armatura (Diaphorina cf. continua) TaxID=2661583 RepID=A0A7R6VYJ0_9PROT|nr:threonine--tRNA ligase [Candidatus Profftella armatura (Diaphorina cf. continua)]BCG49487.1 threonine--tRNA ligase [Candidatus Profftella armatura (Diaphorina cf. continua)]
MISIQISNKLKLQFSKPITVLEVASYINVNLAKSAIIGKLNGILVDLSYVIDHDVNLTIITEKDNIGLNIIRHSTAHLLAYAVKNLFPDSQMVIGPVIENGFYYDFLYKRSFTKEDLILIEKKMIELSQKNEFFLKKIITRDKAISYFNSVDEEFKKKIINLIPKNQEISLYSIGSFIDLCRGPHVLSTGKLKIFKLIKLAGSYWKGDQKNKKLQRIYGTAWVTKKDQEIYLYMIKEAEKRDHRKLGKKLNLFHFQEESPGLIFWHPKGYIILQEIKKYIRKIYKNNGYKEIKTPQMLDLSLWKKTGHWENYKDNMFTTKSENRFYALKPMNCPGHIQIYNSNFHSYRDLPLRFGEFGQCHRNESSGSLHGMMRTRGFIQDDGHIFCTKKQIKNEIIIFNELVHKVYNDFGFKNIQIKLALRPNKRIGENNIWDLAENSLREAISGSGVTWEEFPGEGAFYGPKIEYHLKDSIGRSWQCGTIQIDFSMPYRLGAEYITENNTCKTPVMLHRAIIGSLERFIAIIIENYSGAMPLWLAPIQVMILNISKEQIEYAQKILNFLKNKKFRAEVDLRNEKIAYKIRLHSLEKLPYIIIIGNKELYENKITVRARGNINLGIMSIDMLVIRLINEINTKYS